MMMTKKIILNGASVVAGCMLIVLCLSAGPSNRMTEKSTPKATGKIKSPLADSGWRQLFNGKDLDGWKQVGPGSRYVENGLTGSHGGMGLCYWTK